MNYAEAQATLKGRASRKIANNTYLKEYNRVQGSTDIAIWLHATPVVVLHKNGSVTLDSGGWQTVTTKARINEYAPAGIGITQRAGIWYLQDGSLFYDGVTISKSGIVKKARKPAKNEEAMKKIRKMAKKYAADFTEAIKAGSVGYPSAGDCWHCSMHTQDGRPLGAAIGNAQHIRDHIKESYFVPSLLVNAGHAAGYRDMQVGLMGIGGQRVFIDPENNIYKYVVKQLQADLNK
jgi:hypothetical protein